MATTYTLQKADIDQLLTDLDAVFHNISPSTRHQRSKEIISNFRKDHLSLPDTHQHLWRVYGYTVNRDKQTTMLVECKDCGTQRVWGKSYTKTIEPMCSVCRMFRGPIQRIDGENMCAKCENGYNQREGADNYDPSPCDHSWLYISLGRSQCQKCGAWQEEPQLMISTMEHKWVTTDSDSNWHCEDCHAETGTCILCNKLPAEFIAFGAMSVCNECRYQLDINHNSKTCVPKDFS